MAMTLEQINSRLAELESMKSKYNQRGIFNTLQSDARFDEFTRSGVPDWLIEYAINREHDILTRLKAGDYEGARGLISEVRTKNIVDYNNSNDPAQKAGGQILARVATSADEYMSSNPIAPIVTPQKDTRSNFQKMVDNYNAGIGDEADDPLAAYEGYTKIEYSDDPNSVYQILKKNYEGNSDYSGGANDARFLTYLQNKTNFDGTKIEPQVTSNIPGLGNVTGNVGQVDKDWLNALAGYRTFREQNLSALGKSQRDKETRVQKVGTFTTLGGLGGGELPQFKNKPAQQPTSGIPVNNPSWQGGARTEFGIIGLGWKTPAEQIQALLPLLSSNRTDKEQIKAKLISLGYNGPEVNPNTGAVGTSAPAATGASGTSGLTPNAPVSMGTGGTPTTGGTFGATSPLPQVTGNATWQGGSRAKFGITGYGWYTSDAEKLKALRGRYGSDVNLMPADVKAEYQRLVGGL